VCKTEAGLVTSHAVYQGDFNSAFTHDVVVDVVEPGGASTHTTGRETYEYLGSCPAAMTPEAYSG